MKKKLKCGFAGKLFLFLTLSLVNLYVTAGDASAALDCNGCHGTSGPTDYRPVDAGYRNISTGGFQGNHRNHMALTSNPSSCAVCHNSTGFTSSHRDGKISFQANINGSPLAATFGKGVFVNQTSNPVTTNAKCSNANCHFETITPVWGSSAAVTNCDTCHKAQPDTLSHPKHETALGGTASCIKCHPNRTTFEHATSAGNIGRNIALTIGSYAGSNYNYLPSQVGTRIVGSCSAIYCHSPGQSSTGGALTAGDYATATWGASGACGTCHKATAATLNSGTHAKHLAVEANCANCHAGAVGNGVSYDSTNHVNSLIEVSAGAYSGAGTPGNGYGSCSTTPCHFSGTGSITWGADTVTTSCEKCHGSANTAQPAAGGTFKSTAGNTSNTDVKVGAHVAHLGSNTTAGHQIAVNLSCADCHKSVSSFNDANHIHAGQSVGQAGMAWSPLASGAVETGTATVVPTYDPATGNCTNYCHGATRADGAPATKQTAKWNQPLLSGNPALTNCGVCHGNPPATSGHIANPVGPVYVAQNSCNGCHSGAGTDGMSISDIPHHVDGIVQGGSCNACHGYPPVKDMAGFGIHGSYTTARLQNYSGGGGAHNVPGHIALMAKATETWSPCLVCHPSTSHNQGSGVFVPGNVQVSVDSKYKFDSKLPITYTGNQSGSPLSTGSCSNVSCHFKASPKWSTER